MSDEQSDHPDVSSLAGELQRVHEQLIDAPGRHAAQPELLDSPDPDQSEDFRRACDILGVIERARDSEQATQDTNPPHPETVAAHPPHDPGHWQPLDLTSSRDVTAAPVRFAHFEIIRQLGGGGYGLVFLARDLELNREVALKVPRPEVVLTDDLVQRFVLEAKAAAALTHPHIVPAYEAGRAGPICYIASQYVAGMSLAEWLAARPAPMSARMSAELVAALADAVQHAHSRGVLHRDLKPANILLSLSPNTPPALEPGELVHGAMIADFGLARFVDEEIRQTRTGALVGTPAYMAPEQARGGPMSASPATDIYALGVILYELLTGGPPFVGATILDTLNQVQQKEPVAPRSRHPEVPHDLQAICLKCLEKDPISRYASASDLASDLSRFLRHEPVLARPVSATQRLRKWCKRNPVVAILSAAASLLLMVALAATTVGWISTTSALATADDAKELAEERYLQTKEAIDRYYTNISQNRLLQTPGLKPLRQELISDALAYYRGFLAEREHDESLAADVERAHYVIAGLQQELGEYDAALRNYDQALEMIERAVAAGNEDATELELRRAIVLDRVSGIERLTAGAEKAMATSDRAIAIFTRLADHQPRKSSVARHLAVAYATKADINLMVGNHVEAQRLFEQAIQLLLSIDEAEPDTAQNRNLISTWRGSLARTLLAQGDFDAAMNLERIVSDELRSLLASGHGTLADQDALARSLGEQSKMFAMQRRFEEALGIQYEVADIFERLRMIHPGVWDYDSAYATALSTIAICLDALGRAAEAVVPMRRAAEVSGQLLAASPESGSTQEAYASHHVNLATMLAKHDQLDEASDTMRLAIPILRQLLRQTPDNLKAGMLLGTALSNLANADSDLGRLDAALDSANEAAALLETLHSQYPDHPQVRYFLIAVRNNRGNVLDRLDRSDEAVVTWNQAIALDSQAQHPEFHLKLARSMALAGSLRGAEQIVEEHGPVLRETHGFLLARVRSVLAQTLVENDSYPDRQTKAAEHLQRALSVLEELHQHGDLSDKQLRELRESPDFKELRSRPELRGLIDASDVQLDTEL